MSEAVKALANYGSDRRYHNIYCGYNCRIDELQAALLRVRLSHLPQINRQRRNIAAIYNALITNPLVITPQWTPGAVWHQYVIRVKIIIATPSANISLTKASPPTFTMPCHRTVSPVMRGLMAATLFATLRCPLQKLSQQRLCHYPSPR